MQAYNETPLDFPAISPSEQTTFELTTRHGRAAITDRILTDINLFCRHTFKEEKRRGHLGASVIGHECERYIWQSFRWIKEEQFDGRMLRLFNTGHREEAMFVMYLRGIGFTVEEIAPDTGKQYRIYFAEQHGSGSCDGIGAFPSRYGLPQKLLFEFKTSADKTFQKVFNTTFRDEKKQHWSQVCVYGYKFSIEHILYGMKNKNNDQLLFELEEIDLEYGKDEVAKGERLVQLQTAPPTLHVSSMTPPCKWCHFKGNCYQNEAPEKNCRSCKNAVPTTNAQWGCTLYNNLIPEDFIPKGCDSWVSIL